LIGDKASDIQAGINAGVGCNVFFVKDDNTVLCSFDYKRITSLTDALPLLKSKMPYREAL
jgi:hypothetical protein